MKPTRNGPSQSDGAGVARYIFSVRRAAPLDREEELALVERWQTQGDRGAKDRLLGAHLRDVVAIAISYRRYGVPLEDLIAEGNLGLLHALTKFDRGVGTRFMSYASFWVRAHMIQVIIGSRSLVGSHRLRSKLFFKLRRERAKAQSLFGDSEQADAMLARALGMPAERVQTLVARLDARDVSLDAPLFDDSHAALVDTLASPEQNHEERLAQAEIARRRQRSLRRALGALDRRERFVIEERHLADAGDGPSLAEIGRTLGVSRERARQLETRAKRKLLERLAGPGAGIAD